MPGFANFWVFWAVHHRPFMGLHNVVVSKVFPRMVDYDDFCWGSHVHNMLRPLVEEVKMLEGSDPTKCLRPASGCKVVILVFPSNAVSQWYGVPSLL